MASLKFKRSIRVRPKAKVPNRDLKASATSLYPINAFGSKRPRPRAGLGRASALAPVFRGPTDAEASPEPIVGVLGAGSSEAFFLSR
jgi:hypothetical protein